MVPPRCSRRTFDCLRCARRRPDHRRQIYLCVTLRHSAGRTAEPQNRSRLLDERIFVDFRGGAWSAWSLLT